MNTSHHDTYFLDQEAARMTAIQNNHVVGTDGSNRLQMCYYDGPPVPDAPSNMVSVPLVDFVSFFAERPHEAPRQLCYPRDGLNAQACQQMERNFAQIVEQLNPAMTSPIAASATNEHRDSYFFDREEARQVAMQGNRVKLFHPTITGLQICYHDGEPFPDAPPNLINVPCEQLLDYLRTTRNRMPTWIAFAPDTSPVEAEQLKLLVERTVTEALIWRASQSDALVTKCRSLAPRRQSGEPWRIFLPTDRLSTVIQYNTRDLAAAFQRLGHNVHISIEGNELETLDNYWRHRELAEFNPDIVVHIDHLNNRTLHPDVFNITWWQDPMDEIRRGEPLAWRKRDIVMSFSPGIDGYLKNCGAPEILRQPFCIDSEVFKVIPEIKRENKIVFVGSSYHRRIGGHAREAMVVDYFISLIEAGTIVTADMARDIAGVTGMSFDHAFWNLLHFAVRDTTVRWLCEHSTIPVEIYGRGWDSYPGISKFFKGEVPHGEAVARLYNSARYALVSHPFDINSQRLCEAAACGCIPVIYDVREIAETPHWNDECVFFKTPGELAGFESRQPKNDPRAIGEAFTYERLARRILELVETRCGN